MGLIQFTSNVTDHSNQQGYQFEFHCDKCGNGYMTSFQPSKVGMAGGFLRAASGFFGGGALGEMASAGDYLRDATRGQARDAAFAKAVAERPSPFSSNARAAANGSARKTAGTPSAGCAKTAPPISKRRPPRHRQRSPRNKSGRMPSRPTRPAGWMSRMSSGRRPVLTAARTPKAPNSAPNAASRCRAKVNAQAATPTSKPA
jgi:hypothetical protein